MPTTKLTVPIFSTSKKHNYNGVATFYLHDDYVEYVESADYYEEDETLGINKYKKADVLTYYKKESISSVGYYYNNAEELYVVEITIKGEEHSPAWYVKDKEDAMESVRILKEYLLTT
jgi:hypothetical protein